MSLSQILGSVLVIVGLYLVVTGAPGVASTKLAFWPILREIFKKYPRAAIGLLLIAIGGVFLGVKFGPEFWTDSG